MAVSVLAQGLAVVFLFTLCLDLWGGPPAEGPDLLGEKSGPECRRWEEVAEWKWGGGWGDPKVPGFQVRQLGQPWHQE